MCLCDTWYLLFCMDDCCPVCRVEHSTLHTGQSSYRIISTNCCIDTFVSPDDGHIVAQNVQRLININILRKLCTKLVLFTKKNNLHVIFPVTKMIQYCIYCAAFIQQLYFI